MTTKSCQSCSNWQHMKNEWGLCRGALPVLSSNCVLPNLNVWAGIWPGTQADDFCASYKAAGGRTAEKVAIGATSFEE
jgi:hypothetical protein